MRDTSICLRRHAGIRFLIVLILLSVAPLGAAAQGAFALVDLDESRFPEVSARFIAADASGALLRNLSAADFLVADNGIPCRVLSVSCPPVSAAADLSSVLMIDISGSMASGEPNIEIARAAAAAWIGALPPGASECAIASFDERSYLNQDFTTDRRSLLSAVAALQPRGGTDYDAGLIAPNTGAISVAGRGGGKRVVVFLTDGQGGGDEDAIVARAVEAGVTVYCVTLGMPAPPVLRNVASRTGGICFQNVRSREEAARIYRAILAVAQGAEPCRIVWNGERTCNPLRTITVSVPARAIGDTVSFTVPFTSTPLLEYNPPIVRFNGVPAGSFRDTTITITALNGAVTVRGVAVADPRFSVLSSGVPPARTLLPGESMDVRVRYAPVDAGFVFTPLVVQSDACPGLAPSLSGGYPGVPPSERTLRVLRPNGGEELPAGADTVLAWSGVPADAPVRLEYSTDAGGAWNLIDPEARGLSRRWIVPGTPGRRCLLRVSQIPDPDDALVLGGHIASLSDARFSPDGLLAVTCGTDSTVKIWDAATGMLLRTITPGAVPGGRPGWVRSVEFSPDGRSILVGCDDTKLRIYDTAGILLREIAPASGVLLGGCIAAFSPDGGRIAAGYVDGTLRVFGLDGSTQLIVNAHGSFLTSVHFSPDGRYIATGGGRDRSVAVWDAASGSLEKRFTQRPQDYGRGAVWSRDGNVLAVLFDDVSVYSWPGGLLLREIRDSVSSASFSPDGARLVTGNWPGTGGGTLSVYDVSSGAHIRSYTHSRDGGEVYPVWFSPDGSRIISAGIRNVAKIWYAEPPLLQSDLSDSLWAIVRSAGSGRDVDLGRAVPGDTRDSLVAGYLCNSGDGLLDVRSIRFQGDGDFSIVSGDAPFVLGAGECHAVEFRFRPAGIGPRSAIVTVVTAADTLRYRIRGEGVEPLVEIGGAPVDFGAVEIGGRRDTVVAVIVRNPGSRPVSITSVDLLGPDSGQFSVVSGGGAFTLAPGEGHAMTLRFAPLRSGRTSGGIAFGFSGDGSPVQAALFGEGVCPSGEMAHDLALDVPEREIAPGERILLPLLLRNRKGLPPVGGRYSMAVRLNRRILFPLDSGVAVTIAGGDTLVHYEGVWDGRGDTLALLEYAVALGDAAEAGIMVESFRWDWNCPVAVRLDGGSVRVRICREGERPRLLLDGGGIALKPLYPNPSGGAVAVEFSTSEIGPTELLLVDLAGRTVATLVSGDISPGEHRLTFDGSALPSGFYHCVLRTPTRLLLQPLIFANPGGGE